MSTLALLERSLPSVVNLRHRLHQIPEIAYEEFKTAATIRAELDRLKIPYIAGVENAPTATIAWLGDSSKPCIALRADIDALPITEQTGAAYASTHPGRMHACGHDGHAAGLVGVASVLQAIEKELPVCVKFIWQPAEETGGGAERVVNAGALDGRLGPKVDAIFGLHGWPGLPVGTIATGPGALLASTDNFAVTFRGRGCHGGFPHLGRDPVVAASEAVLSLQQVVSREFDPADQAVVTVGIFSAGTAVNIIPDTAHIAGTARTLHAAARAQVQAAIRRRCEGIAAAHDCTLEFEWTEGYPPTINDEQQARYVERIARQAFGDGAFHLARRAVMAGEDFAYYLEKVPGCFFFIGVQPPDRPTYPPLHNDHFDFNDAAFSTGMRMFVELVMNWKP